MDVMYNCIYIIANLANLFNPIMPNISEKLAQYLDIETKEWKEIEISKEIIINSEIQPLFERIK